MTEAIIPQLLDEQRFETARRVCREALARDAGNRDVMLLLHRALRHLGDIQACREVLESITPGTADERLQVLLLLGEDFHLLAAYDFFRGSVAEHAGLTGDEYAEQMEARAAEYFAQARALAVTDAQRRQAAEALRRAGRAAEAEGMSPATPAAPTATEPAAPATGTLSGRLTFADGQPVVDSLVTLGLAVVVEDADPASYLRPDMGYEPHIGTQESLTARTDSDGRYTFTGVPAGRHEFLAVTLDPEHYAIATRFFAHDVVTAPDAVTHIDAVVEEWRSAPPRPLPHPFPDKLARNGITYRLAHEEVLANPFYYAFPRQMVTIHLPAGIPTDPRRLLLLAAHDAGNPAPFQLSGDQLSFFAELPAVTDRGYAVYLAQDGDAEPFTPLPALYPAVEADGRTAVISTGRAGFRIPWGSSEDAMPPLLAVRGEEDVWRGSGRFILPAGIEIVSRETTVEVSGPLLLTVRIGYTLSNGMHYSVTLTAHQGEAYLLAHEVCPDLAGMAVEFSLREFHGGRGFLHWTPENGGRHWSTLAAEERELARLQESVAWWIPPQGFGYAMTADGPAQGDYIGVFTVRRGEWIDRKFARIAQGPGENRELDWPFPEMVGSTVSMITAHTDQSGDAYFRFKAFDGERRWGMLVSTLARNDGSWKEISAVQHKNSSPRLQDFKEWRLDAEDETPRPAVVIARDALLAVRRKKTAPEFARYWARIAEGNIPGPALGVKFAVDGDPLTAWRIKRKLVGVARIRSRMTLLGRDYADSYSPVGARPITPWAEEYDLVAASGVFTADEERLVRAFFMLMGHMYMETDLMNWRFNSRNANFEADRVDVVGAVGLAFYHNPDARRFVKHAAASMERALEVYSTPGSGKWYENPACYYLQALKCRTNLAFHLAAHGIQDPTEIERMRDFLRWGVLLLTPPYPVSYPLMLHGTDDAGYRAATRVRRIPPVGDHAHIGTWMPEHYALMAAVYRKTDPAFADLLLWGYQESGADGGYHSNMPMLFSQLTAEDLLPAPPQTLTSRRLEGFGAIFRGNFAREDEFYLLFKLGPGGYRYHRTEGSLILFADGKPLIFDGGEAGETWRHTTLSFHDVHTPLAPGHIERFYSFAGVDFAQGVNPTALRPGEPVFLSDLCDDNLVEVAYQRITEPNPANARSVIWVKDEYVVLHDELNLPSDLPTHWHLQAVAQGESGNARDGYRFRGRFGTDLQVLLPDQQFSGEQIETLPTLEYYLPREECFTTRHLQLSSTSPTHILAVLRPLFGNRAEVTAQALCEGARTVGVRVQGASIDDRIFHSRHGLVYDDGTVHFAGRYGMALQRDGTRVLALLDGAGINAGDLHIESDGVAVYLTVSVQGVEIAAEGHGRFTVRVGEETFTTEHEGQGMYRLPQS